MLRSRYRKVSFLFLSILVSVAFWELLLPRLGLRGLVQRTRVKRFQKIGARFRARAIELGGVLIKVGQFLSARVDVIPLEITAELAGLQDEVPPEDFANIRQVAEAELGGSLEQKYLQFDPVPMAAASLGQVHRARLLSDSWAAQGGSEPSTGEIEPLMVVVKVQRPDIERIIATDMAALRMAGKWINRYPPVRKRADVPALISEFERVLMEEIDYLAEGHNAERFAENFQDNPMVKVPRVAWERTTKRVLTLEDVQAIKITSYDEITAAGLDRGEVASCLLDTYLQQIFEDGFFHADPHPGNLFVAPLPSVPRDGQTGGELDWQLTFVDFGMVGKLTPEMRAGLRELLVGVGTRDSGRIIQGYRLMGVLLPGADLSLLERAGGEAFDRFWGKNMNELQQVSVKEITDFASQFRDLIYDMPFQIPQDLILIGRTVGILSGMCTGLDPQFNVWEEIMPYARKFIMEEGGEGRGVWREVLTKGLQRVVDLPVRIETLLAKIERGELEVRDSARLEETRRMEKAVRRVGLAVAFSGLLLAGVQIFLAGYPTAAWGLWALAGLLLLIFLFR